MKPRLINFQMIDNAKKRILHRNIIIRKNNNFSLNMLLVIIILLFILYMYYRYINKNKFIRDKNNKKKEFSNQILGYYNSIKRKELLEILNNNKSNDKNNGFYNEYQKNIPNLVKFNNKNWVKKPMLY